MKAPLPILECRSAIIFPLDKQVIIHNGEIEVKGWSYSGGGNWVERVEVSPDGYDGSREISIFDFFLLSYYYHGQRSCVVRRRPREYDRKGELYPHTSPPCPDSATLVALPRLEALDDQSSGRCPRLA